jgi:hypothetical protein
VDHRRVNMGTGVEIERAQRLLARKRGGFDPEERGALFSGDIFMVVMDRRWVSFMYSIYGGFWGRVITADGADAVRRSADRYLGFALADHA